MPSTTVHQSRSIDRNANSPTRTRRNWQRLKDGAVVPTIPTLAPITGGQAIGLEFNQASGLGLVLGSLSILFSDFSIAGSSTGIHVVLNSTGALKDTSTGLAVQTDGTTISTNSSNQLTVIGSGSGSVTSVGVAVPSTIFTVSGTPVVSTGTITIGLQTEPSTTVLAGPSSGANALPAFRRLSTAEIAGYAAPSTFLIFAGTGISTSTGGVSTVIVNTAPFISTGVLPTVSTNPGSPTDGQAWYNTTTTQPDVQVAGVRITVGGEVVSLGSTITLINPSTITDFGGATDVVFPANFFKVGRTIQLKYGGTYNVTTSTTTAAVTKYFNTVGTGPFQGGFSSPPLTTPSTSLRYYIDEIIVCQSTGISGSFSNTGIAMWEVVSGLSTVPQVGGRTTSSTVNTTAPITLRMAGFVSASDVANTVSMSVFDLFLLN